MNDFRPVKEYEIMNKDNIIGYMTIGYDGIHLNNIYGGITKAIYNYSDFLFERTKLQDRANIAKMAKIARIDNEDSFITKTSLVSVTDCIWVREKCSSTCWDSVSPWRNSIGRIWANLALDGRSSLSYKSIKERFKTPQFSLGGVTDKCVIKENGTLKLIKGADIDNSDRTGNKACAEYIAYNLAKLLGIKNHVEYKLRYNNSRVYCVCDIFSNEDMAFVPNRNSRYGLMRVHDIAKSIGGNNGEILNNMRILDAITLNFDRHDSNFGYLYNTDTYEIKSVAPIFDNDSSLLTHIQVSGVAFDKAYDEALDMMEYMDKPVDYIAVNNMTPNMEKRLYEINGKIKVPRLKGMSELRRKYIEKMVNLRVAEILKVCK